MKCGICGKSNIFDMALHLQWHRENPCPEKRQEKFECMLCHKVIGRKDNFKRHMITCRRKVDSKTSKGKKPAMTRKQDQKEEEESRLEDASASTSVGNVEENGKKF